MPDSGGCERPVRLGTSGWRGVFGEEFTLPRLRAALRGAAAWFDDSGGGEVVVAHDTRFLADRLAALAAHALTERGLGVIFGRGVTPTPVAARTVRRRRAAGALVLTASHNGPEYQGLKVLGRHGGSIGERDARALESRIAAASRGPLEGPAPRGRDLGAVYARELLRRIDAEAIGRARPKVWYDAMHGAGGRLLPDLLAGCGARTQPRRTEPDPHFGGCAPDPHSERLAGLAVELRAAKGLRLGLASDGDADRFAAVDEAGRVLTETEALALLVDHMAKTGRVHRGVAISVATGSLVERVAERHGLAVSRHGIGFKHLTQALAAGEADLAGEESGGFAWGAFSGDKDGLLAGALLTERVAAERRPLGAALAALYAEHGRSACGRVARPAAPAALAALDGLIRRPPARVDGARVERVRDDAGLHLGLADGFLMLRVSGTEPLLRIYAEAPSPAALKRRLAIGAALMGAGGEPLTSR